MFVQNQIKSFQNHGEVIANAMADADEIICVVAYVRENGVDAVLSQIQNKKVRVLCSLDMGITQITSIKKLIDNGVEVKVYKDTQGTFHPKIWFFGKNKKWQMLIGSANFTDAAFHRNVEASVFTDESSITTNAMMFFEYLWKSENSNIISKTDIIALQETIDKKRIIKNKIVTINKKDGKTSDINKNEAISDDEKIDVIFDYVKNWIDIPKHDKTDIGGLWRGWYIIPDQGYVDDNHVSNLVSYLQFIDKDKGLLLEDNANNPKYQELLARFELNSEFKRHKLKTNMHGLFVRQAKNYLIKFGWCYHPLRANRTVNKRELYLSELGEKVCDCAGDLTQIKTLYSDYFFNYHYNGIKIVPFIEKLLKALDYLTIEEVNYFAKHIYAEDDYDAIVNLIKIYRGLSDSDRSGFHSKFKKYFDKVKEPTGINVYGNYTKSIKNNISAVAWCEGFEMNGDFQISLTS
ncbi:MAG: phospholipase D family protein [Alphaproteobacteria bacterium]|nr:phospholipase D family protein [Alphaproteobacteria bacterium]